MKWQFVLSGLIVFEIFFSWPAAEKVFSAAKYDCESTLSNLQESIKEKNYLKARELSNSLLRYFSDSGQILYLRAALSQKMGQNGQAVDDYNLLIMQAWKFLFTCCKG